MRRFTLLFIAFLLCSFSFVFAQEKYLFPADDLILRMKVAENPSIIDDYIKYEKDLKMFIDAIDNEMLTKTDTLINGRRIIPVVFHIIHRYGPENISKEQVLDAIEKLNLDFNKLHEDTSATFPLFKSRAADCKIEFRLATIDPNGNCTDGIVRYYDPQTDYAYFATMKQYHWPTENYMNVYAVNFIYPEGISLPDGAFIGGMSPFPPTNTLSQALTGGDTDVDGVLIRQDCIGTIGTAVAMAGMPINQKNRTFTHEIGHYLNLYHTFQNLMLGLLPAQSGCHSFFAPNGDEVGDTPQVAVPNQNTSLACIVPGSVNSCSDPEPDMVENYMDYQFGYCCNIYTNGQKARMDATLLGYRRHLWSVENLIATGVLDISSPPLCEPVADFTADYNRVCAGSQISFVDQSFNGEVQTWDWSFPGGDPSTSNDEYPIVTYNTPGNYDVSLTVTNSTGTNTILKSNFVAVIDESINIQAPIYEGFEASTLSDFIIINEAGNAWEVSNAAAYSGSNSIRINNFSGNPANSLDAFITPAYDLTTMSPTVALRLKFKYAYVGKINPGTIITDPDTAYDRLRVYVSRDCGKTWAMRWQRTGEQLITANPIQNAFTPSSLDQWKEAEVNIHTYLSQGTTGLLVKFEFQGNGGNNLYIDDIVIDNGTVSVNEYYSDILEFNIYPNPTKEQTIVSFNLPESAYVSLKLTDMLGRDVVKLNSGILHDGNNQFVINAKDLDAGIYFVKMDYLGQHYTTKLIVQ